MELALSGIGQMASRFDHWKLLALLGWSGEQGGAARTGLCCYKFEGCGAA